MPINVCGTAYHALPVPAAVETRPCVALVGRMQIARPCGGWTRLKLLACVRVRVRVRACEWARVRRAYLVVVC